MALTEEQKKIRELHDALNAHEWVYFLTEDMKRIETAVSRPRRYCLQCKLLEFDQGYSPEEPDWRNDGSSIATTAIELLLDEKRFFTESEWKELGLGF